MNNDTPLASSNPVAPRPLNHDSRPIVYQSRPSVQAAQTPTPVATTATIPAPALPAAQPTGTPIPDVQTTLQSNLQVTNAPTDVPQPIVAAPAADNLPKVKILNRKRLTAGLSMVGVMFIVTSVGLGYVNRAVKKPTNPNVTAFAPESEVKSVPSEKQPTAAELALYRTAPDIPRLLTIPKLKVTARVTELGIKDNGSLMPPGNIYDTAWFNSSAKPGASGVTVIEGHTHGPTKAGVFDGLDTLKTGDKIQIETGSKQTISYKVVKSQIFQLSDLTLSTLLKPAVSGQKGLNLVTASGTNSDSKQRLLVYAVEL